jgi:para-aminobenzoate synthetase / 4-amino-4-deoxychorismate lyase
MFPMHPHTAVLRDGRQGGQWLLFRNPHTVVTSNRPEEVIASLQEIDSLRKRGAHAVGFIGYEAAAAFDSAFKTSSPSVALPLVWFGLYERAEVVCSPTPSPRDYSLATWNPSVSLHEYRASIDRIKDAIQRGDTYQVNYTMRLRSRFRGDPWAFFLALHEVQHSIYASYINLGRYHICSVSPELFFSRINDILTCKPMKGTAKRGYSSADDRLAERRLRSSSKNLSENVMIVDMVRNDVGRIAVPGSVRVDRLFAVERYPTVLQMTSTVSARVKVSIIEAFRALFPCASITGAPKVKTMEIIRQLESEPRGIYTGTIGHISPNGDGHFNVAIRTVVVDTHDQCAEYGTGGGIVWESNADEEYQECLTKAGILIHSRVNSTRGT